MVTGQTGVVGQNVPRVVVEDSKQGVGRALTRVRRMEVVIAREAKLRQPHVTRHHVRVSMAWSGIGLLRVVSFFSRSVEQNAQETKLTKGSPFFLRLAALLARA